MSRRAHLPRRSALPRRLSRPLRRRGIPSSELIVGQRPKSLRLLHRSCGHTQGEASKCTAAEGFVPQVGREWMLKRRLPILFALSIFSAFVPVGAQVMASPATPGFEAPVLMPGSSGGTEPSLAISNNGIRYVSWQSPGEFARSADGVNFVQPAQPTPDSG